MLMLEDAFGKALFDYWKGDKKTPLCLREKNGAVSCGSVKQYFGKKLFKIEEKSVKYAKGKILDIGCGAGRHILYLQKKKFDVLGIDISPLAIRVCKERGCKKAKIADIFKANFKDTFDTLILFGRNIGIGGNLSGVKRLLKKLNKLVNRGGKLLLTDMDASQIGKAFKIKKIRAEYKNVVGDWFNWIRLSPVLVTKIGIECGWKTEKIFKDNDGSYAAVLKKVK